MPLPTVPNLEVLPTALAAEAVPLAVEFASLENAMTDMALCLTTSCAVSIEPACQRRERRHVERVQACVAVHLGAKATSPWRRPPSFQKPCRETEREARLSAVAFSRWARQAGLSASAAAQALGVSARTLRNWRRTWHAPADGAQEGSRGVRRRRRLRGRPRVRSDRRQRNAVLEYLFRTGPQLSLDALRHKFPQMPVAEVARLRRRFQRQVAWRTKRSGRRLLWQGVGRVWAMDFVVWSRWVVLSVRDVASRRQLLWLPLSSQETCHVTAALRQLFDWYEPPLVMKVDNGQSFTAQATRDELASRGVAILYSPVRRPQYNGVCERGNRTMKEFTQAQAAAAGRPGRWQAGDLDTACRLANEVTRLWGRHGPSPDEAWEGRSSLGDEERQCFLAAVARNRAALLPEWEDSPGEELTQRDQDCLERDAISATLQELAYLIITHRRDPRLKEPPSDPWPALAELRADNQGTLPDQPAGARAAATLDQLQRPDTSSAPWDVTPSETDSHFIPPAPASTLSDAPMIDAQASEEKTKSALAGLLASETPCTLEAGSQREAPPRSDLEQVASAHGGPRIFQFLRRPFIPLLNALKAAKIK
jgi:transposase InsO family protein